MITIFTIPKPFDDKYRLLQYNAIRSWKEVIPDVQILLFGDELGIREAGIEFDCEVISDISKSTLNTPYLDEVFKIAHDRAHFDLICYVNTDIIFLPDFVESIKRIRRKRFLMIGCRYDIDVSEEISIDEDTELHFRKNAVRTWESDNLYGSDFFLFTKDTGFRTIPNFIVGRPGWDNWIIYKGRMLHVPVIDASKSVFCVHQNHDYSHVPKSTGEKWEGVEGDHNLSLFSKRERMSLIDASHRIEKGRVKFNFSKKHRKRYLSTLQITHPGLLPLFRMKWFLGRLKHQLFNRIDHSESV